MNTDTTKRKRQWAKELRGHQTKQERILWNELRSRRFQNLKFRRQVAIGRFIADFCCCEHHLIVEVDGPVHDDQKEYDREREQYFQERGYRIIRCTNDEVEHAMEHVLMRISEAIKE